MAFENSAGIGTRTNYGVRKINEKFGGKQSSNITQYVELVFDYDDLPTAGAEMEALIPANSLIKGAYLEVITPFAGGTSYNIGLAQTNGTIISAGGLYPAIPSAALNQAGKWKASTGTLIGNGVGAAPAVITVVADGTYTAGKARLVVEYIPG